MKRTKLIFWASVFSITLYFWTRKEINLHPKYQGPFPTPDKKEVAKVVPKTKVLKPVLEQHVQHEKIKLLREILVTKNDNDPRLDREFNNLSPITKRRFEEHYEKMDPERFNERGTIVFLLGKNLSGKEDFDFLKKVLDEPPCKSLADCKKDIRLTDSDSLHHDAASEVTLAYPQVVALKSLENFLKTAPSDKDLLASAYQALDRAKNSPIPIVSRMAFDLAARL